MAYWPPYHQLVRGMVFIALIWMCMASPSEGEGSADMHENTADDEDGKILL